MEFVFRTFYTGIFLQLNVFRSKDELAQQVSIKLAQRLASEGNIGFATGKTMEPLYAALRTHAPLLIRAHAWMLDEYLGLAPHDERSFLHFLRREVFTPLAYSESFLHYPALDRLSPEQAARDYDQRLTNAGGLDVQLLGIGMNGHVGFNEPGSAPTARARVVKIAQSTREANQADFGELAAVPQEAVTLGMRNILEARELWLIATGTKKAKIVKTFLGGSITPLVPASLVREHPGLQVFLDQEAASLLS